MDLQATKLDVVQKILMVQKASLLDRIKDILDEEMIVGYSTNGSPLTKKMYLEELQDAKKQIIEGEFTTQEDLEKESDNW